MNYIEIARQLSCGRIIIAEYMFAKIIRFSLHHHHRHFTRSLHCFIEFPYLVAANHRLPVVALQLKSFVDSTFPSGSLHIHILSLKREGCCWQSMMAGSKSLVRNNCTLQYKNWFFFRGRGVKNLGDGWSKSIVLENKVVLDLYFRHVASLFNSIIAQLVCNVLGSSHPFECLQHSRWSCFIAHSRLPQRQKLSYLDV